MAEVIKVTGLRETIKKLETLGASVADLKTVMNKVGNVVAGEAESLAPKKSGALAGSIRANKAKGKAVVKAGSARVPYAGVQNYGGYHNIQGSHFMEKALSNKQGEAIREFQSGIDRLIDEAGL